MIRSFIVAKLFYVELYIELNVFYLLYFISMCEIVGKMVIWLDRRKFGFFKLGFVIIE